MAKRSLSVTAKLALIFTAVMFAGIGTAIVTFIQAEAVVKTVHIKSQLVHELENIDLMEKEVEVGQSAVRAFLLTGDEAFLSRFDSAVAKRQASYKKLVETAVDGRDLITQAEELALEWENKIARRQIALMQHPDTVEMARTLEVTGESVATILAIEEKMTGVREILFEHLKAADHAQDERLYNVEMIAAGSGVFLLLICLGAAFFSYRGVSQPISAIANQTRQIADGDLATEISYSARGDEIGDLSRALTVFRDNLADNKRMEEEVRTRDDEAQASRRAELNTLAEEFENSVKSVVDRLGLSAEDLTSNADKLSVIAERTSTEVVDVSSASEEASVNVQTVAAAADQLSDSVKEINGQIDMNSRLVVEAATEAERTNTSVGQLRDVVSRIGEVTNLIQAIAEQTNLLALNATIEAARAGDAGKGFAVVASEVKALANQTATATEQIESQIAQMQSAATDSIGAVENISTRLTTMRDTASSIAAAAEEQGMAIQEIARNVSEAAQGTSRVSSTIGNVRDAVGETGTMSGNVKLSASDLTVQARALNEQVDAFLIRVRAG